MTLNRQGVKAVFLFIAELNGFKSGTVTSKIKYGINCYLTTTLHDIDYSTEDGRADAHENIWLERIYDSLDAHYQLGALGQLAKKKLAAGHRDFASKVFGNPSTTYQWQVPIELDASASMLQYMGVLLNDSRLTSMTNVIGSQLSDPWKFDGIPRGQFKKAATPLLYGSSRACHELWQDGGFSYTVDQIKLFNQELSNGALGLANQFKEFLINHCKPTAEMLVHIKDEQFVVECNRYRNIGEKTTRYDIYDTETDSIRRVTHTDTKKVPDLDQFRRYFVTLLIHNLDSQVANTVIGKAVDKYGFGIDIHDAFIVHPNAASDVRHWYAEELNSIHSRRSEILTNYFESIGIGPEAQSAWQRVQAMVSPIEGIFKANKMALK